MRWPGRANVGEVHGNITPIQGSTTSHEDVQRAVDVVTKETGYIDLLINNAGMTTFDGSPNARPKPTAQSTIAEVRDYYFNYRPHEVWTKTLDTNIASVFTTSMAFLELLHAGSTYGLRKVAPQRLIRLRSAQA